MKFNKREIPSSGTGGGNLFLKIADGQSVTGVLRGENYEFYNKWVGGKSQLTTADDPEGKSRFRANFVTLEDGKFVPKIWEFGLTVYNQLADMSEEYDLEKTKIKITRRGSGTDTVYMILPIVKEPIPAKVMKEIEAVELLHLQHKPQTKAEPPSFNPNDDDDEIPF